MRSEIVLDDLLDDLFEEKSPPAEEKPKEPQPDAGEIPDYEPASAVIFDIETGAMPWEQLKEFWSPPPKPGVFDEKAVKLGNTKDPAKVKAKIEEARTKHTQEIADWQKNSDEDQKEFMSKAALSPVTGQVLAIGLFVPECGGRVMGDQMTEEVLLDDFWRYFERCRLTGTKLIGFNSHRFDLPFLIRRSWALGVRVPSGLLVQGRFWANCFIDLMQVWSCGAYGDSIKLDTLAQHLGCTRKNGDGAMFAALWRDPKTKEQAKQYLLNDVKMTYEVAVRMGVIL